MRFWSTLKNTQKTMNEIDKIEVKKSIKIKATLIAFGSVLILIIPFVLIFTSLLKQNSHIMFSYRLIMISICLLMILVNPLISIIYYECLLGVIKDEEISKKIKLKDIFIIELLNPIIFIIIITIVIVVNIIVWR